MLEQALKNIDDVLWKDARKRYTFILGKHYRWEEWAAPKGKSGPVDHNQAMTGAALRDYRFKERATGPKTIQYKIGEIKNKISSGYDLREIINHIDELRFLSQTENHEHRTPQDIMDEIDALDAESAPVLQTIWGLL